jgi:formamidopyrimidine-DNA glycosylase
MPELPEVETVRRGLESLIVGKTIKSISHDNEKSFPNDPTLVSEFAVGSNVSNIKRRAKVLLIELSTSYTLMTHLKMTGQLVYEGKERFGAGHPNDSLIGRLPDKSTRVTITFDDDSCLYFNDQRKFGWMKLLPSELVAQEPFMLKVGPEPLEPEFTDKIFIARVRRRANTSIKAAILDQTVLAGVGNIYADESLWGAQIHPATLVRNITDKQLSVLHREILYVLNLSIEKGGSTDRNYVNAEGKRGSYIDFARVFRQENKPCPRCQTIVIKTRVAGRGTHLCPKCQKHKNK